MRASTLLAFILIMFVLFMMVGCARSQPPGGELTDVLKQHERQRNAP